MKRGAGAAKPPPGPEISVLRYSDGDFTSYIDVQLRAGTAVIARVAPFCRTDGVSGTALDSGVRWEASADAKLLFPVETACNAMDLDIGASSYVVAADLALLWTTDVRIGTDPALALPDLAWVAGSGTFVLRFPGYGINLPYRDRKLRTALVDPAHFAWAKASVPWVDVETDGAGQAWIKLSGQEALVHSGGRPGGRLRPR